jgi:hypothetical protein
VAGADQHAHAVVEELVAVAPHLVRQQPAQHEQVGDMEHHPLAEQRRDGILAQGSAGDPAEERAFVLGW